MDLQKTKIYLDKLSREYARMAKDPENVVRIDVDIMLSYVRELYDALLSETPGIAAAPKAVEPAAHKPPTTPPAEKAAAPAPPEPVVVVPPPPPPVVVAPPPVAPPVAPPVVPPPPPPPAPAPEPVKAPIPPVKAPAAPAQFSPEAEALFEEKQAKELSEKLSELPIADLRKAIALNDRLLLTRELFAGDGQSFDAALNALNICAGMDEAKGYLIENCVLRYGWLDKKREEAAKNFIKLVRRRFK